MTEATQPLAGIKVVEFSTMITASLATMMFAQQGADVIKVEPPGIGDPMRWLGSQRAGISGLFHNCNQAKRSITLDLKSAEDLAHARQLCLQADVVIHNYRPGVMDRLGLGYKEISKISPKIIYCSATGYGQTGPYRNKPGHDINYLGISGILGCTGEQTGRPVIPGIPFGDMAGGGLFPALTILAALLGRERTGNGQYIDVAQTDVLTSLNIRNLSEALAKKKGQKARPVDLRGFNLCYNTFKTKDGKFISSASVEPKFWANFCKAIGREDWISYHMLPYEEGSEATENLKEFFLSKTQKEWTEIFENVDTCVTPILTSDETLMDKQLIERGVITTMDDPKRGETIQIGFPAKFSQELNFKRLPPPLFGEHTTEVLNNLGYTSSQIETLKKDGII